MNIAEIIGLHRNSARSRIGADRTSATRKKGIWWQIYQGDRLLSLLLGLSHSLPDAFCDLDEEDGISETTYIRKLAIIANRIIDRNQAVVNPSFSITYEIDAQMETLAKHLPPSWWALPSDPTPSDPVPEDGPSLLLHFWSQFWHFQVEMLLHLPFMLRSTAEVKYEYSKNMCLKASREMIRRFIFMKENAPAAFRSFHMVEFQVFLAAVVIQLNLLHNVAMRHENQDHQQRARDEEVIDDITREMTFRGDVSGVTEQVVEVLKALKVVGRKGGPAGNRFRLIIPYFGTIFVTRGHTVASVNSVATGGQPPLIPGDATYLDPAPTIHQRLVSIPESVMPPEYSLDFPQISFSSGQFLPNGFMDQNCSLIGNLEAPFDYTRVADLDGTWDWFIDDNLKGL